MTKTKETVERATATGVFLTREQAMNCLVFLENTTVQGKVAPAFMSLVETLQQGLREANGQ